MKKAVYESDDGTSATFYIDLPPERIYHSKSSGRPIIPIVMSLFFLLLVLLQLYTAPDNDDVAILNVPSVQEFFRFIATRFAEWIPRFVSSLMLLYVGICLGYAGVRLYLETNKIVNKEIPLDGPTK
jgi:hypothetical protein